MDYNLNTSSRFKIHLSPTKVPSGKVWRLEMKNEVVSQNDQTFWFSEDSPGFQLAVLAVEKKSI